MGAPADVLVVFGITGDLAKVMTFRSLYRLELRGCWTARSSASRSTTGRWTSSASTPASASRARARSSTRRCSTGSRRGSPTCKATSPTRPSTSAWRTRSRATSAPVFYLEIPPFLFGTVVKGLSEAGLTDGARVVVEKPFGHDRASARELAAELHQYIDESQLYRIDHYLGKMGLGRDPPPPLRELDARAGLEPELPRVRADHDGGELRRRGSWPLLRSGRCAARRRRQPPHAGGRGGRDGGAVPAATPQTLKEAQLALFRAVAEADPAHYVRGQYDGYLDTAGVAPDSTTETYAALRLDIENWRWSGVPFFIRTGKRLAGHADRAAAGLQTSAPARVLGLADRRSEPNQLVVKLDPSTGVRLVLDARRADAPGAEPITLDMEFAEQGGEGATPYEVLLHAAMIGRQHALHAAGRGRGDVADHAAAAGRPAAGASVRAGVVGPGGGRRAGRGPRPLARAVGGVVTPRRATQSAAMPSPFPPIDSTTPSCPIATRARWSRPTARSTGSACPSFDAPSVFGTLLDREAGQLPPGAVRDQRPDGARLRARARTCSSTTWRTAERLGRGP